MTRSGFGTQAADESDAPQHTIASTLGNAASTYCPLTCLMPTLRRANDVRAMTATTDALHAAMRLGLEQVAVALADADGQRCAASEAARGTSAETLYQDVLALACRGLVREWLKQSAARPLPPEPPVHSPGSPRAVTVRDEAGFLAECFPLSVARAVAIEELGSDVHSALAQVVDLAHALAAGCGSKGATAWLAAWDWVLVAFEHSLQLIPRLGDGNLHFDVGRANTSHARRASGSYYTPPEIVDWVLDRVLEPALDAVVKNSEDGPSAVLSVKLVDPACGTGRFLVAAAQRLTQRILSLRGQPSHSDSPEYRHVFGQVVQHCIHGVDLNSLAVGWCKLSLWLRADANAADPTLVAAHIKRGHALLGAVARCAPLATDRAEADAWCASFFGHGNAEDRTVLASGVASKHAFFHWQLEYPDVFARGGFDIVIGNPPWIAHAGRAAQSLGPAIKAFYRANYEAFAGYRTTHGLFISLAARLLRLGGRLGLVVPSSVSELDGYRPTRLAHDRLCDVQDELKDFGEGMFAGVTQPCMALVSERRRDGRCGGNYGSVWPIARPDLDATAKALILRLEQLPRLPPALFGERGLQTDAQARRHFNQSGTASGRFTTPIREGTDVREFQLLAPRWHVDPVALGSRLRSARDYQRVDVIVRQTARYPIAALSDGLAFRNSLLAAYANETWTAPALVALLNSALVRWLHFSRFRDARQPVLPQVKIAHLRAIPVPASPQADVLARLALIAQQFTGGPLSQREQMRRQLDDLVYDMYGLAAEERALIEHWFLGHR